MAVNKFKVAVLGTGVMGSQIAAHLTNAKIPVLAFDWGSESIIKTLLSIAARDVARFIVVVVFPTPPF